MDVTTGDQQEQIGLTRRCWCSVSKSCSLACVLWDVTEFRGVSESPLPTCKVCIYIAVC